MHLINLKKIESVKHLISGNYRVMTCSFMTVANWHGSKWVVYTTELSEESLLLCYKRRLQTIFLPRSDMRTSSPTLSFCLPLLALFALLVSHEGVAMAASCTPIPLADRTFVGGYWDFAYTYGPYNLLETTFNTNATSLEITGVAISLSTSRPSCLAP